MGRPHPYWPLFDLRIRTPRLELRLPTDDDFPALLAAIDAGIHDPAAMPFAVAWTDAEPDARRRGAVQHWWRQRAEWAPDRWDLALAVEFEGELVGIQGVHTERFPVLRTISTGSWLTQRVHGRGIGKEMRSAALEFAFEALGADVAESGAFDDNAASLAVSRALGYEPDGESRAAPRGEVRRIVRLRLPREKWVCRYDVRLDGVTECLPLFGLG
jgi:RimJ/RimL family protein N-acetyltransferase